jgi:Putative Ig domain
MQAAVTFTITPAVVSNTYPGAITLQVAGLTNGETVVVQKFLDLNTNGAVDASDWLVQQFKLTEGRAGMVIGGVTNLNVPGDTDTLGGQITAKLNFRNGDFIQNLAGQYLFRLTSPSGNFAPLTSVLSVANFPYGQNLTGSVVSNGTSATLPNAIVMLFPPARADGKGPGGPPLAGAVTDNAGNYTIPAPAGNYAPIAFKANYVSDFSRPPLVTLSSAQTVTTNLTVTSATSSIAGQVVDANNSSLGLPGILLSVQATNGLMGVGCTDTNGNFTVGVQSNPSQWWLRADDTSLIVHGYLGLQDRTNANAGQTGVMLAMPKATALFYGTVKDILGNPMPGIDVYVDDNYNYVYQSDGYTDTAGKYFAAALGGLSNDPWQIQISSDTSPTNYLFSQADLGSNGGTNLSSGTAVQINFTGLLATNHITGSLKDDTGNPISGVQIYANATLSGISFNAWVNTDANGNYSLSAANGTWTVGVNCCCGDNVLPSAYRCPGSQTVNVFNNNGVANFAVQTGAYQISGTLTDNGYNPIAGVHLYASNGSTNYLTAVTGTNGFYSFVVNSGNWDISVECGDLSPKGFACLSDQSVNISNSDYNGLDFVAQPCLALQVTSVFLPGALVGAGYNFQLQAAGCSPSYTWSLTPGSLPLPAGLTLSSGGNLTGTPTVLGTNYFSIRVTDTGGGTADELLQLNVYPPMQMSTNALPNGTVTFAYNAQITVAGGHPGYYVYVSSGFFPPGLNIYPDSVTSSNQVFLISGTPTGSGTFAFTLEADDTDGNPVQRSYIITIAPSTLQIVTTSLSHAVQGINYTYQLEAAGGAPPYTWTIALGSQPLPSGFSLSTNGIISGVTSTSGAGTFIVRLTDHNSTTITRSFTLTINPRPALIVPRRLSASQFQFGVNGVAGQNYTVQYGTSLTNWTSLFITNSVTGSFIVTDSNATNKARYYRLLLGP